MSDPRPLSDADLLAWAVVLEYRRQQRDGITILLLPYPPCPTCGETVTEVLKTSVPERFGERLVMNPCRHGHAYAEAALLRIEDNLRILLRRLETEPGWNTERIIDEARARVDQQAATDSHPEPAPDEPTAPGLDPRMPAYDAVYAYVRRLGDRMPADPVHRNAIIWRAVSAALDAMPPPYRQFLARLERELAQATRTASHATVEEVRLAAQGIASGLKIATAHAITLYEGREVREAWLAGLPADSGHQASELSAPADPDSIRADVLRAIDFNYVAGVLGYPTPEELLAAYDTSREQRQRADEAEGELKRVRQLHRPVDYQGRTICAECSGLDSEGISTDNSPVLHTDCATLKALEPPKEM
ncbi:hypothetical protein ACIHCX_03235 [Streptomyces sp. NPDC052043]|uniref:hypothetical protein n=1 Tax=Streptomyces sp. NPDC052043 TaxID=3365684 RepID=UPI0037D990A1